MILEENANYFCFQYFWRNSAGKWHKYNITLESNIFTLKQYYMILEKCIFIYYFFFLLFKELNWQMTLKQYNMILEK